MQLKRRKLVPGLRRAVSLLTTQSFFFHSMKAIVWLLFLTHLVVHNNHLEFSWRCGTLSPLLKHSWECRWVWVGNVGAEYTGGCRKGVRTCVKHQPNVPQIKILNSDRPHTPHTLLLCTSSNFHCLPVLLPNIHTIKIIYEVKCYRLPLLCLPRLCATWNSLK